MVNTKDSNNMNNPTTLSELKSAIIGTWKSLSVELRPTEDRTGTGNIKPVYLTREFNYSEDGSFSGTITMFADNYGKIPSMEFEFKGHLNWGDTHPIAEGAFCVDYVLDDDFSVTPLSDESAGMLNYVPVEGIQPFAKDVKQSIFKKAFPLFSIAEGEMLTDYDLLYLYNDLLFFGAKHVDGTPFDKPDRRPHQLQVPLVRK